MPAAPIALFCFRRPRHLDQTLAALAANHGAADHDLIAFADGPRRADDEAGVADARRVLEDWRGRGAFRSFTIDSQPANLGLRRSVVRGVGRMCDEAGSVIVVEDDLVTSPHFLGFCRNGLSTYANAADVASIHGYCYPVTQALPETFFLRGADCWGWATWKRAWAAYRDDAGALLTELRRSGQARHFDQAGARDLTGMLQAAADGTVDSWAIRWHASAYLARLHTLYPGRALVRNIGFDTDGTHCQVDPGYAGRMQEDPITLRPQPVIENPVAWQAFADYHRGLRGGLLRRGWQAIRQRMWAK